VDPAVQLWNRSFLDNLYYGTSSDPLRPLAEVIDTAELRSLLEVLPEGHQTVLGEGGGLVSGGEGQRVRFGRALLRPGVRLVILDEPFRGLDRTQRSRLLVRSRELWKDATLLYVTHDVAETLASIACSSWRTSGGGRRSRDLSQRRNSRYRLLLESDQEARGLWSEKGWRRLHLDGGRLHEADLGPRLNLDWDALSWPLSQAGRGSRHPRPPMRPRATHGHAGHGSRPAGCSAGRRMGRVRRGLDGTGGRAGRVPYPELRDLLAQQARR
jgi:hypothetical protein